MGGHGRPPSPVPTSLGVFHPAVGPATLVLRDGASETATRPPFPELGGRTLIGHDVKPSLEWWLARGGALPAVEDTAVAAYLLNPARTNYKLEEVCAELLGQGPGIARPGTRARWIWDLWAMQPRALQEVGLHAPLPGRRAAADRRARAHGAPRHPGGPGPPRRVLTRARGASRADDARDLHAGGRGVQHRLAQAARPHPLREAQAAAGAAHQDRLLDRRGRARAARRSATSCPRASSSTARSPSSSPPTPTRCRR